MQPPPNTLPLSVVSANLASLFERAFSQRQPSFLTIERPTANHWVTALDAFEQELQACPTNNRHRYSKFSSGCPWCALETKTGVIFFAPSFAAGISPGLPLVDIETLWKRIERVSLPTAEVGKILVATPQPGATFKEIAEKRRSFWWRTFNAATILRARNEASTRKTEAESRLTQLRQEWVMPTLQQDFQESLRQFDDQRKAFHQLDFQRQRKFDELKQQMNERQLRRHLETCLVRAGAVSGIGVAKEAILRSYGIDTAYDLTPDRILAVPGFGPALASRLIVWRKGLEQQFRFDPTKSVDPRDVAALDADIYAKKKAIIARLEGAPAVLQLIVGKMEQERQRLRGDIKQAMERRAQAEADLAAIA